MIGYAKSPMTARDSILQLLAACRISHVLEPLHPPSTPEHRGALDTAAAAAADYATRHAPAFGGFEPVGWVWGGPEPLDNRRAKLSEGECWVDRAAVEYYGSHFLARIGGIPQGNVHPIDHP
ncbi:hypothetical protein ACWEOE_31645 [Amycolatopsis sp. NPDC004368]